MELGLFVQYGPALLSGFAMTVLCWVIGTIGGAMLGFAIAIVQRYANGVVWIILQAYVEIIRGTPFLVQLFLLYYGAPNLGLRLGSLEAGLVGLIIYSSPYFAEIFRAGFESVPKGQIEAARAIGFAEATILLVSTLPALTNFAIILTKETVILSVVTVPELLYQVQTMSAETFAFVEANLALALFFWIFVEGISRVGRMLENRVTHYLIK